jgi:hypothetical protein
MDQYGVNDSLRLGAYSYKAMLLLEAGLVEHLMWLLLLLPVKSNATGRLMGINNKAAAQTTYTPSSLE